jgi:hypothetical protein
LDGALVHIIVRLEDLELQNRYLLRENYQLVSA